MEIASARTLEPRSAASDARDLSPRRPGHRKRSAIGCIFLITTISSCLFSSGCTPVSTACAEADITCHPGLALLRRGSAGSGTVVNYTDFNGDGFADRIGGARANQGPGAANKGAVYIFYGSVSGNTPHPESVTPYTCSGPPDCTVIENPDNEANGNFGIAVAPAGDLNGDGFGDLIVGAWQNQGVGANDKGAAYIFYGSAAGITMHPESATPYTCTGPPDCTVIQNPDNETSGHFGVSVSGAGDVNGDGFADVIVGANQNQGAGSADKGTAYIFYGSATGITAHPESAAPYVCSGPPDCTVFQNPDETPSLGFAGSVATAGDVNRDGFADVIVGAYQNQGSGPAAQKGTAYIFYGSTTGIKSHPESAVAYGCSGPPDCTVFTNPDEEFIGFFSRSVAAAGDVNGDGFSDVIVGAAQNQGGGAPDKGAAYIFYGSGSGITSHPESAIPYACSGPPDCTVIQNPDNETNGHFGDSVGAAGDVNGDGFADVTVGASQNQGGGAADKGAAYIFYGGSTGITTHTESAVPYVCAGPPDCTVIQNPDNEASGFFGFAVSTAGDVNRDGFADVIIGAKGNQGGGIADKGAMYIFYGSAAGITAHAESAVPYVCAGPPDCTVIQNPDNEGSGLFGASVARAGPWRDDGNAKPRQHGLHPAVCRLATRMRFRGRSQPVGPDWELL